MKTIGRIWCTLCVITAACLFCLHLGGCAVGFGDKGEVIGGVELARMPENAGQFLRGASEWLPAPWNSLAGAGIALLGLGGQSAISRAAERRSAERARKMADDAWDEATARTEAAARARDAEYTQGQLEALALARTGVPGVNSVRPAVAVPSPGQG